MTARDPRDIRFGYATVPRAVATTIGEVSYPAGWALPGGQRTDDRDRAVRVAVNIDRIIGERTDPAQRNHDHG